MSLNNTPSANRLHIGIYGKTNSGKSSLINALTNQNIALVSEVPGTTGDPVYKTMELHGIGPCVFIDTAGFDEEGHLGILRVNKTKDAIEKSDIALMVFSDADISKEKVWVTNLKKANIPIIYIINKADILSNIEELIDLVFTTFDETPMVVSAKEKIGLKQIHQALLRALPKDYDTIDITDTLVARGDHVLLVMPQDIQAPKGRLILPQVQTIRELLDKKCIVTSVTTDQLDTALASFIKPPEAIITDSQVFKTVYEKKPATSKLTSFSVLFAGYKGDIEYYLKSVSALDMLTKSSKVLIVEACTHAPLGEDIGRVQIPRLLREKINPTMRIDHVSGADYPENLAEYDLIIHCGACMFNRKHVLSRIHQAKIQNVPMTNYGIVMAYFNGIIDKIYIHGQ